MNNNNELKEINIKYRTYCYFNVKLNIDDIDFNNILLDEQSY